MALLKEFAIQLYSVKDETAKDFPGALKHLGEIGYTGVEFAGYGGIAAKEMKGYLDAYGLRSVGTHAGLDRITEHLDEDLEYNSVLGTKYIIIPWATMDTRDDALRLAELMNKANDKIQAAGFEFGYHNHAHEFKKDCDEYLMDILYANLDKKIMMELDLYWAACADVDYIAYMEKHKGILKLLHVKQIKDYESKQCVDLDEGVIDFKTIVEKGLALGVTDFILEQEEFAVGPWESVKKDYDYMMNL